MRSLLAVLIVAVSGCRFEGDLPGGGQTRCQSNSDCPSGAKCVAFGVCAQIDSLFLSKRIEPAVVGPKQTVRVTLEFEKARSAPPTVWAYAVGIQEQASLVSQTESRFDYQWTVPPMPATDQVVLVADGATANQRVVEIGTVAIDIKPPQLQLVSRQLTPPSSEILGTKHLGLGARPAGEREQS